jgi:hypothetical protein
MGSDDKGLAYDPGLLFTTGLRVFFHSARDIPTHPFAVWPSDWFASATGGEYGSAAGLSIWKDSPTTSMPTPIGPSRDNFAVDILAPLSPGHVVLAARIVADKRAYFTTGKNPGADEDDP